jgi:hypothetical protein
MPALPNPYLAHGSSRPPPPPRPTCSCPTPARPPAPPHLARMRRACAGRQPPLGTLLVAALGRGLAARFRKLLPWPALHSGPRALLQQPGGSRLGHPGLPVQHAGPAHAPGRPPAGGRGWRGGLGGPPGEGGRGGGGLDAVQRPGRPARPARAAVRPTGGHQGTCGLRSSFLSAGWEDHQEEGEEGEEGAEVSMLLLARLQGVLGDRHAPPEPPPRPPPAAHAASGGG